MVMLQPLAIALRTDRGRRNIMVHTRSIPSDDVGRCTAQLMTQLARCVPSSAAGPDLILGIQSACLSQGVFEATGRRYIVTWRMLNEVMIISIVPSGTSILTAHRASRAVAQLLLIYCKSTTAVTMDRLFKKYVQIHAALGALLRDNGQDHQRAFLDGEGIIGLLKPGAQQQKAKTLLGLANKDKQHAATRAGDRALQEVLDEAAHASALAPAPAQRVKAASGVTLPHQLSSAAVKASAQRNARVRGTTDGFTRPELARAAAAAAAAGEVPDAGGALAGLDDVVALPGFQMPSEQWPNRLADPEGKLRPPEERGEGSIIDEEEEEEEESEVASEEEEEVVSKGPQPLPGLGDVSDVMLVEQWHALFVGTCMEAAATSGHVVVTRSELACFIKIGVPSGRSELLKAVERARGHSKSFIPEDAEAIRKREIAEAGGTAALETESEYSADLPDTQPALRLAVRAKDPIKKGGSAAAAANADVAAATQDGEDSPTKVDISAPQPVRSVIEYQLTAAQLPPPFLACMQVHEIPLGEASSLGLPKWDVFIRVRIQASQQLPSPTIHGTLALTLPDSAPTLAASSVKASYVKRKNVIHVVVPPLNSEGEFDLRVKLSGSSSVSGPGGENITGLVRLFSEPMKGSLTGTCILSGNSLSELEANKGHYLCNLRLKPVVQRFPMPEGAQLPSGVAAEASGTEASYSGPPPGPPKPLPGSSVPPPPVDVLPPAADAGAVPGSAAVAAAAAAQGKAPPGPEGYAPVMPGMPGAAQPTAGYTGGPIDSMKPLV